MQAKERRRAASPEVAARIKREASSGRVDSGGRGARAPRPSLGLPQVPVQGSLLPASGSDSSPSHPELVEDDDALDLHFGLTLRRAREQQGLSLHEVADQTRISVRWLAALEEARTEQLPAPVFVIGYLRSYTRVLGLSGDELIESYRRHRHREGMPPTIEPFAPQDGRALAQRRALLITLLLVLIGAVALAFLLLRARH